MNRFHNKYHRHNHHSLPTAGEPDSAHDPIASKESPFKGEFHVDGPLSATSGDFKDLNVSNNFTVSGKSTFIGPIDIHLPISTIFEHILVMPKLTTQDYYFKIDSNFNNFPLMEVYLNGNTAFMITTAMDVGIGTSTPEAKLDVIGDIKCFNLSAINIFASNGLSVSGGGARFSSLTADNTSRIGYLEIGYVPNQETYLKTISGNKDLWFYTDNTLNLKMHPTGKNYFPGKVGIGMEPVEPLTLSGQMGFRTNGIVLLDNSYTDTLRIITNRGGDDDQHLFTFTYDGRFIVGDIFHDYAFPCTGGSWMKPASHKINAIDLTGNGQCIAMTSVVPDGSPGTGPIFRMFRTNGDLTAPLAIKDKDQLGSIKAHGFTGKDACYGDGVATIDFQATNDYDTSFQGAAINFITTESSDSLNIAKERMKIDDNGNVGINTLNLLTITPSLFSYRNTTRPAWKLTVRDYDTETRPAAVIFAGVSASPMMQIIGGEGTLEQTALRLSDRNIRDANTNHIEFTHGAADVPVSRVSSLNRGIEGINGGSLLFSTTPGGAIIIPPLFAGMIFDPVTGDIIAVDLFNNVVVRLRAAEVAAGRVSPVVIAGVYGSNDLGVDGPITSATFNGLEGVCADTAGNLYVVQRSNGRLRKISSSTVTTIFTASGPLDDIIFVPLTSPARAGNLIVANGSNGVQEITTLGVVINAWNISSLSPLPSGSYIEGIAIDIAGNIYAADYQRNVIYMIDTAGILSVYAGIPGTAGNVNGLRTGGATFNGPCKIIFDAIGNMYIAHMGSVGIRKIDTAGNVTDYTTPSDVFSNDSYYMAIDNVGNIYVTPNSATAPIFHSITPAGVIRSITVGTSSLLPFERARINFDGDTGIGIKTPNSRLHIQDDDKTVAQAAGTKRDVLTISTLNNTNGLFLSSVNLQSRLYNNSSRRELHLTTSTANGKIKFSTANEAFAAVITDKQNVGIGIDESLDTLTTYTNTNIRLGVNGDTMLFNTMKESVAPTGELGSITIDSTGDMYVGGSDDYLTTHILSGVPPATLPHKLKDLSLFQTGWCNVAVDLVDNSVWWARLPGGAPPDLTSNLTELMHSQKNGTLISTTPMPAGSSIVSIAYRNNVVALLCLTSGSRFSPGSFSIIKGDTSVPGTVTLSAPIPIALNIDAPGTDFEIAGNMVVDAVGNVFIANKGRHTILKLDTANTITTLAGQDAASGIVNGVGNVAQFNSPVGLVLDPTDNSLLVADLGNNAVRRVQTQAPGVIGDVTTVVSTSLDKPIGVAINLGFIFVVEYNDAGGIIKRIDPTTSIVELFADGTQSPEGPGAKLFFNKGVDAWNTDPLYIHRYNQDLNLSELRVNIGNEFCVIPPATPIVTTVFAGTPGSAGTGNGPKATATFSGPSKIAKDSIGNTYVADTNNNRIRVISPLGIVATFAGSGVASSVDGVGTAATFNGPRDIVCDSADNLYVIENNSHSIRKITTIGTAPGIIPVAAAATVTTLAGSVATSGSTDAIGAAARFNGPRSITIDDLDIIFLAESPGRKVRMVNTATGAVATLAGSGVAGVVDDVGALALFDAPEGIATDSKGTVYISEQNQSVIRKISVATGKTTTIAGAAGVAGTTNGIGTVARFTNPTNLCLDGNDLLIIDSNTGSGPLRILDVRSSNVTTVVNTATLRMTSISKAGTDLIISADNHTLIQINSLGKPLAKYDNEDVFTVGAYPAATPLVWDRWIDVGACSTVFYNNISATGDAYFDNNVTIKGALSVVNTTGAATKIFGDLYVDGNIYATGDMTAFCGCQPPTRWPWPGPHPPIMPLPIPSDSRLKLNQNNIQNSLEKIATINGINFDWDESKQDQYKGRDVGVIAQEIEKILPEIVHERPDGYKGVQYEKIIPLLIECIKDLKKEIDLLKLR